MDPKTRAWLDEMTIDGPTKKWTEADTVALRGVRARVAELEGLLREAHKVLDHPDCWGVGNLPSRITAALEASGIDTAKVTG